MLFWGDLCVALLYYIKSASTYLANNPLLAEESLARIHKRSTEAVGSGDRSFVVVIITNHIITLRLAHCWCAVGFITLRSPRQLALLLRKDARGGLNPTQHALFAEPRSFKHTWEGGLVNPWTVFHLDSTGLGFGLRLLSGLLS